MLTLLSLAWVVAFAIILNLFRRKRSLPPGPRRLPFVGNLIGIPLDARSLFSQWYNTYGALVYIEPLKRPMLVINTYNIAIDLFSRRSRLYSDRPWNYVAAQLMNGGHNIAFMNYNDKWRRVRKAAHDGFRESGLAKYRNIQNYEAIRTAISFIEDPSRWEQHLVINAASTILSSVYGLPPTSESSPVVQTVMNIVLENSRAMYPGAYAVEFLPWLRHIPIWAASWKQNALQSYTKAHTFLGNLFHDARHSLSIDGLSASLAYSLHDDVDDNSIEKDEAIWLCGVIFQAGAETTSTTLLWFILAMVLHGDSQQKAQDEIDRVVGREHPPSFDHIDSLHYVGAIVKEVLRWRPPLPLGVPHCTATEDTYNGFDIPAKTVCIPNTWEINRDPAVWGPDVSAFRPQRHLTEDGTLSKFILSGHDDSHVSFGFGQRICVGRHFAEKSLLITCATILWACNIRPAIDENGDIKLPLADTQMNTGVTLHPAPFECRIEARGEDTMRQLKAAREATSRGK